MQVLRVVEVQLQPGSMPEFLKLAAIIKPIIDKAGTNLSFYQVAAGGDPNTLMSVSAYESLGAYATAATELMDNQPLQESIAALGQILKSTEITLYNDIAEEVGGDVDNIENPQIVLAVQMKLLPGKREAYINILKQIREVRMAEGLPVFNALESKLGEGGRIIRTRLFESLAAYAETANLAQPASVKEIIEIANKDPEAPYAETIQSRLLTNITGKL